MEWFDLDQRAFFEGKKKIPHEAGLRVGEGSRALEFSHVKAKDSSADHFDAFTGIQLDRPVLRVV